jgi:RHS repeat-associated protein
LSELRSSTKNYYEADGLGSITSLSNTAGALENTYTYDSFGKLTALSGTVVNPFQYTSRDFDSETGLRYYRARYYDHNLGRFLSEDPIRFRSGVDFYVYVRNNPTNLIDPRGLQDSVTTTHAQCDKDPDQSRFCSCHCNLLPIADSAPCEKLCKECFSRNKSRKETCVCLCNLFELPNCDKRCCGVK